MRQIILYGLVLGALLLLIQYAQYRLVLIQHAESLYVGLIAAICCAAGIWAGINLTRRFQAKREVEQIAPPTTQALAVDSAIAAQWGITARELEVLALMAQGLSNQEIAAHLFLSLNTVKTHISNIFSKLDVQRRTQAVQRAKALGVLGE